MATRRTIRYLMSMMTQLEYCRNGCEDVNIGSANFPVKGDGFLLDNLTLCKPIFEHLGTSYPELKKLPFSLKTWIKYLEEKYDQPLPEISENGIGEMSQTGKNQLIQNLSKDDAEKLQKEISSWANSILAAYSTDGTVLLTDALMNNLIPSEVAKKLDKFEIGDLTDGITALQHLLPTPAAVILLRVGERVLQKYYKTITKTSSGKQTWGQMLSVLEKKPNISKSLLGYFHYLNEKRIDSAHPYRRYSQEEGERILLNVKDLLESVYLPKKREV